MKGMIKWTTGSYINTLKVKIIKTYIYFMGWKIILKDFQRRINE